ncbi:hypothetical protein QCA50_005418 [Cerrena zonata]|uniref:Phospholipid/glycerol acyltransferase domain-containing protein n=1 Tax=Cerrena zonata TaxID=2478898 RepID=A0AAW0GP54_9APHY
MAPLLVYRSLREASDWMLNFYSELVTLGHENVSPSGPLLIVACHHNEAVDIGALAVTIPHGRVVRFWAKASLFRIPLIGNILTSSGALPVHRKRKVNDGDNNSVHVYDSLFGETVASLGLGEVIGVFPEGTSYTHPHIPPLRPGAARVALEFSSWQAGQSHNASKSEGHFSEQQLKIVPVGIVYNEKMQFRSRVCVRYGKPIGFHAFARQYSTGTDEDRREAINALTHEIHENLTRLTVNAPNWDVYHAAHIARDIAYEGRGRIPLEDYTSITQRFVSALQDYNPHTIRQVAILLKYHALLHHTNITHSSLSSLYPSTPTSSTLPSQGHLLKSILTQLAKTFLHPRFWFFIPPFLLHLPGYLIGNLGAKYIVDSTEDETQAGTIAICGGITYGITASFTAWNLYDLALGYLNSPLVPSHLIGSPLAWLWRRPLYHFGLAVSIYVFTLVVFRWHNWLIDGMSCYSDITCQR